MVKARNLPATRPIRIPPSPSQTVVPEYVRTHVNAASPTLRECGFLVDLVRANGMRHVLEFGPGANTFAFIAAGCTVVSVEPDKTWFDAWSQRCGQSSAVRLIHYDFRKLGFLELPEYATGVGSSAVEFDLCFVDSPPGSEPFSRLNTCLYALEFGMVLVLHDANRRCEQNTVALLGRIFPIRTTHISHEKGFLIVERTDTSGS